MHDERYATTRRLTGKKSGCFDIAVGSAVTLLGTPDSDKKIAQGGLRLQGCFKTHSEDKPLITVVTVVYNGAEYLEDTIKSVIDQTYDNIEYIIIDGASTDGTLDVIRKYEHAIDYWVSEPDKGIYDAMNKGIDLAAGDWINFMNGGDSFFSPEVLTGVFSNQIHQDIQILYGNHQVIYQGGRTRLVKGGQVKNLWKGSQFCHQATFVKCKYHKESKFNFCTKIVADFEFFYRARISNAQFKFIDIFVARFEAGGISDVNRIDSILGHWTIVKKTLKVNAFYLFLVAKEIVKAEVKRFV
jgi:glycosyltransferase involved in cell wall biosynthesis